MPKSPHALAVDRIQAALRPLLAEEGFRVRGRTFNRSSEDGLTHVVNLQIGPSDPPGTTYVPGLTENLHGLFTVNLGVYVPEVYRELMGGKPSSWAHEFRCCVRARLGYDAETDQESWWHARSDPDVIQHVRERLTDFAFPWLQRFATRDRILAEWRDRSQNDGAGSPPRLVLAVILLERGERERARALLAAQVRERTDHPSHQGYVRGLAKRFGLFPLDEGADPRET